MAKVIRKPSDTVGPQPVVVKVADLVARARAEKPQIFGNLSDKRAENLARSVIQQLGRSIEATQEGSFRVPGFGSFAVKMVEKIGVADEKITARRVVFRPVKAKEPESAIES